MKSLRPVRENCFGWWLADLDDEPPCRQRVRPLDDSICRVCRTDGNDVDTLRNKQLVSPTSVPSRQELLQLIQSGRLRHLERHQNIIEAILGTKPKLELEELQFLESEDESDVAKTPSTPSPVEVHDDVRVMSVIEEAVRNGHIDEEFARQVSRLQELSANLTELRTTSRLLHRDLRALDAATTRITSSVRSLRRDAEDLCFLEKMVAAAEGVFPLAPSDNLII